MDARRRAAETPTRPVGACHLPGALTAAVAAASAAVGHPCDRGCEPVPGHPGVHIHGQLVVHARMRTEADRHDVLGFNRLAARAGVATPEVVAHGHEGAVDWYVDRRVVDPGDQDEGERTAQLADLLGRLHRLEVAEVLPSMGHPAVLARAVRWVRDCYGQATARTYQQMLGEALRGAEEVVVHADVSTWHNTLVDRAGTMHLIDPHPVRLAPAAYELAYADAMLQSRGSGHRVIDHYTGPVDEQRYRRLRQVLTARAWLAANRRAEAGEARRLWGWLAPEVRRRLLARDAGVGAADARAR